MGSTFLYRPRDGPHKNKVKKGWGLGTRLGLVDGAQVHIGEKWQQKSALNSKLGAVRFSLVSDLQ